MNGNRFIAKKAIAILRRPGDGSTLSLDFTAMSGLDSRFTFTRASTATYINSSGLVTTMAAASTNDPTKARFDHDPTTLAPRGLLSETSATNFVTQSSAMNNWTFTRATASTPSVTAPDGASTSVLVTGTADVNNHLVQNANSISFTPQNYTFSVWLKAGATNFAQLSFTNSLGFPSNTYVNVNLSNGTLGTLGGAGATATISTAYPNGWYRVTLTANQTATLSHTGSCLIYLVSSATAARAESWDASSASVYVFGAQLEAGSGASSYIPTGASTVQRAADVCTLSGTAFSSWFNSTEGTFLATGERAITSNFGRLLSANANNTTSAFDLGASTTGRWLITNTTSQADITAGTVSANTAFKVAGAFANNDAQIAFNGTLGTADTSVSLPTVSQLDIGADRTAVYLNGRIRSIKFWPTRLPNATLQSLTQ